MTDPQDNVTSLARAPLLYVALTLALPLATGCAVSYTHLTLPTIE